MNKEKILRGSIFVVLIAVFLAVFIFSTLTPLLEDDFAYAYSFYDYERIENVSDIFPSMDAHRSLANGRVVAHFFAQLFILLPKVCFNLLNSVNAVAIAFLLLLFSQAKSYFQKLISLLTGIFLIFCFTPDFGQVFLWLDGSCNYSWAMGLSLLFLYPFYYNYRNCLDPSKKIGLVFKILLLPLSLMTGAYSESASLAAIFIAACLLVLCFRKTKKVEPFLAAGIIVALLGYFYLMSAPIEHTDRGVFEPKVVIYNLIYVLKSIKYYQLPLYMIYAVLLILCFLTHVDKDRIILSVLFFLGGVGSAAAFSFAKYCPARALCPITVYTVLSILVMLSGLFSTIDRKVLLSAFAVLTVFFCGEFLIATDDIITVHSMANERETVIHTALMTGERNAVVKRYYTQTKYSGAAGLDDVSVFPEFWVNIAMARYYGLDSIAAEQ